MLEKGEEGGNVQKVPLSTAGCKHGEKEREQLTRRKLQMSENPNEEKTKGLSG